MSLLNVYYVCDSSLLGLFLVTENVLGLFNECQRSLKCFLRSPVRVQRKSVKESVHLLRSFIFHLPLTLSSAPQTAHHSNLYALCSIRSCVKKYFDRLSAYLTIVLPSMRRSIFYWFSSSIGLVLTPFLVFVKNAGPVYMFLIEGRSYFVVQIVIQIIK